MAAPFVFVQDVLVLHNIRIVLINTFHPGNIGAAARAMKNMGLSQLYLVNPNCFPCDEASSRAAGAEDLLERAKVVSTLDAAISDCHLVVGTSARTQRAFGPPLLEVRTMAAQLLSESAQGQVALVFGCETTGMLNTELQRCNLHAYIPANPDYPVLNISQAIQLFCYEIYRTVAEKDIVPTKVVYPRYVEVQQFYQHLEQVLRKINFIIPQHEGKVQQKLQRFFNRARPERTELNMLRGILTAVEDSIEIKDD